MTTTNGILDASALASLGAALKPPVPILGGFGNSWVARGFTALGLGAKNPVVAAVAALRGRVQVKSAALVGFSGQDSTQIVTDANLATLLASGAQYVYTELFINNATNSVPIATTIANLNTYLDWCAVNRIVPIVQTVPPRGDANNTAAVRGYNSQVNDAIWAQFYSRPRGSMLVVDSKKLLTSGASSVDAQISGVYDTDNVHLIDYGANIVGQGIADVLSPLLAPATQFYATRANIFDRTLNPTGFFGNAAMAGNTGVISAAGSTGVVPTGWTLTRPTGTTFQAVCSKVSGYNGGEYLQMVLSSSGVGAQNEQLILGFNTPALVAGDVIQGLLDCFSTGLANVKAAYIYLNGAVAGTFTGMNNSGVTGDTMPAVIDRIAVTPELTMTAAEVVAVQVVIVANCTTNAVAGTLTIRSAGPKMNRVGP